MRRIPTTLVIALILPMLVLAAMAAIDATPDGWKVLVAFTSGVVAATVHWRSSTSSEQAA